MKREAEKNLAVIAMFVVFVIVLLSLVVSMKNPGIHVPGTSEHEMPSGNYVTTKTGAGADSLDNLAQMDDCIRNRDQACESSMLLDGRAFVVEKGTSIDGQEVGYGVFEGRVRSGALVGKEIYLPSVAFK